MSNELEGRDLLTAVVDMHEQGRPVKWISRSTGLKPTAVNVILKAAGFKSRDVTDLGKYDRMENFVLDGVSHSEIARTLHTDHRTIERWFPGTGWTSGGWGDFGGLMRELHRKQTEFERSGRIQSNRDAGFGLRSKQA